MSFYVRIGGFAAVLADNADDYEAVHDTLPDGSRHTIIRKRTDLPRSRLIPSTTAFPVLLPCQRASVFPLLPLCGHKEAPVAQTNGLRPDSLTWTYSVAPRGFLSSRNLSSYPPHGGGLGKTVSEKDEGKGCGKDKIEMYTILCYNLVSIGISSGSSP